ncbi:unnamed protein product [Phaedon cochleariae]|uniref:Uncharacterized protein n=1 Tax=Phaedon cochleariae TaxID=80249 RepID=A0A9P0DHX5_PHACE|nr:unnamed protein product [Phaedon cochleariae]
MEVLSGGKSMKQKKVGQFGNKGKVCGRSNRNLRQSRGSFRRLVNRNNRANLQREANFVNNNGGYASRPEEELKRGVYNAPFCVRLTSDTFRIPDDSVQALFNDMQLFPPKSQECPNSKCDVFLGGSCNPTTWRADTAIPELQKHGISFYNPQVSKWEPELVAQEYDAKQAASILLFVIDSQTRSTVGMIEVAYLVASGRCVVVVAQPYERGQTIMGEVITDREYRDLVDGQRTLLGLVKSKGVKIHSSLSTALQCTAKILRNSSNNGTSAEDQIRYKLRRLREIYDSYGGQMKLHHALEEYMKLTDRSFSYNCSSVRNTPVSFERFCSLMAELSSKDGCDMCTSDVWATQPFRRQCSTTPNCTSTNNNISRPSTNGRLSDVGSCDVATPLDNDAATKKDIFLGGSFYSERQWRRDVAIPMIKKHGLSYYNPTLREDGEVIDVDSDPFEMDVLEWKRDLDGSRVLLMVITDDTRSMTSIILAAFYMGLDKDVVLCVQSLPTEGCVIGNETLTKNAVKDYNRARVYLKDLAVRKQVPVFENITEAVQCAIERCKVR